LEQCLRCFIFLPWRIAEWALVELGGSRERKGE